MILLQSGNTRANTNATVMSPSNIVQEEVDSSFSWLVVLSLNIFGYSTVLLPAAVIVYYLRNSKTIKTEPGCFYSLLRLCIIGGGGSTGNNLELLEEGKLKEKTSSQVPEEYSATDTCRYCMKLLGCLLGLQMTYLTWGLLQERIMTRTYNDYKFTNSQFLVFMNRISALLTSGVYISLFQQPPHIAPLYKYSFSSFSNILSSWCQYEALKYISYPTLILSKSCKIIPVMLMGKLVSNKEYSWYDYLMAVLVSMGMTLFLLATKTGPSHGNIYSGTTASIGLFILFCYMLFDSFTSNWQSKLFNSYKMTSFQMMFGVNIFSSLLTFTSLLVNSNFLPAMNFFFNNFEFAFHTLLLSVCSATGQLFIYYTISQFGPLVFTLIVTTRQAVSLLLSCIVYGHTLTVPALVGISIVFVSLLLRTFLQERSKKRKQLS